MDNGQSGGERDVDGQHYLEVATYHFKCHISEYIRALHNGQADGVILKQYNKPVALLVPLKEPPRGDNGHGHGHGGGGL